MSSRGGGGRGYSRFQQPVQSSPRQRIHKRHLYTPSPETGPLDNYSVLNDASSCPPLVGSSTVFVSTRRPTRVISDPLHTDPLVPRPLESNGKGDRHLRGEMTSIRGRVVTVTQFEELEATVYRPTSIPLVPYSAQSMYRCSHVPSSKTYRDQYANNAPATGN